MNSTGENGGNNNTDAASDAMLSRAGRTVSVHEKADEGEETRIPLNIISVMTKKELDTVLEWAALEKWNPSLGDTGPYLSADRDGFFINRVEEGGEPIASASGVRYGEDYGFVGLYICKPSHRGRGHGVAVFERAMSHLEGRIIGLDAVKVFSLKDGWYNGNVRYTLHRDRKRHMAGVHGPGPRNMSQSTEQSCE